MNLDRKAIQRLKKELMRQPQFVYRETFPKRGYEHDCSYIDKVWDAATQSYIDNDPPPLPEATRAAIREIVAREHAERLLKAKPGSERIQ